MNEIEKALNQLSTEIAATYEILSALLATFMKMDPKGVRDAAEALKKTADVYKGAPQFQKLIDALEKETMKISE